MKGRVRRRPLFSGADRFRAFLQSVAAELAEVEGVSVRDGEHPGGMPWLRIATSTGQVDVWDGAEVGEQGVFIQAYEIPEADEDWPAFIGDQTRVCDGGGVSETAHLIRSYLAGPSVAGRQRLLDLQAQLDQALQVEEGKLQPQPQQPRLVCRDGCRVDPGQVT